MNTQTQEALKMAIKAMKDMQRTYPYSPPCLQWEEQVDAHRSCKKATNACEEALEQPLTRDWKETIDERIAKDDNFKEALAQPTMTYEQGFAHGYEAHRVEQKLQQPTQEPVAWIKEVGDKGIIDFAMITEEGAYPVYTHPSPSWQGISEAEAGAIFRKSMTPHEFARAIEQALRNKNGY